MMNDAGPMNGVQAVNMLRGYIDKAYNLRPSSYNAYEFFGTDAAADDMVYRDKSNAMRQFTIGNAQMTAKMVRLYCKTDAQGSAMLEQAITKNGLSARAYDRILKVARTIADLEGSDRIESAHIWEAINYRVLDKNNWTDF